jgi:hypothetical protein
MNMTVSAMPIRADVRYAADADIHPKGDDA